MMPDGQRAISASNDGTLKVWELDSGRELQTLSIHTRGSGRAVDVLALVQRTQQWYPSWP